MSSRPRSEPLDRTTALWELACPSIPVAPAAVCSDRYAAEDASGRGTLPPRNRLGGRLDARPRGGSRGSRAAALARERLSRLLRVPPRSRREAPRSACRILAVRAPRRPDRAEARGGPRVV